MLSTVTLIAPAGGKPLSAGTVETARAALIDASAAVSETLWLAADEACDLAVDGLTPAQADAVMAPFARTHGLDQFSQAGPPDAPERRKRLLVADMDSTIVTSETLDELSDHAGIKDAIAAITARAMNGELGFEEALRERVGMIAGLSADAMQECWAGVEYTPGARELVGTMRAHGGYCVLVSGGFDFFTARVAGEIGFHEEQANRLEIAGNKVTGTVLDPIVGREAKLAALERHAERLGITPDLAIAVGDGANDLQMIQAAGLGVAFHAKPVVAADAKARVERGDLSALLFAQGYRREEFRRYEERAAAETGC